MVSPGERIIAREAKNKEKIRVKGTSGKSRPLRDRVL